MGEQPGIRDGMCATCRHWDRTAEPGRYSKDCGQMRECSELSDGARTRDPLVGGLCGGEWAETFLTAPSFACCEYKPVTN